MNTKDMIPFSPTGDQYHAVYRWLKDIDWRVNDEFDDSLQFISIDGWAEFHKSDGGLVYMGKTEFNRIVKYMENGILSGRFKYRKIGRNYNIMKVEV